MFKSDILNFTPFGEKVCLSSPTMHGDEMNYIAEAFETNWVTTIGENINEIERIMADYAGCKYAVALSAGTAALHLAVKLAGVQPGDKVFCSDLTKKGFRYLLLRNMIPGTWIHRRSEKHLPCIRRSKQLWRQIFMERPQSWMR